MKFCLLLSFLFATQVYSYTSQCKKTTCSPLNTNDIKLLEKISRKYKQGLILAPKLMAEQVCVSKALGQKKTAVLTKLINSLKSVLKSAPTLGQYNQFLLTLQKRYRVALQKQNECGDPCVKLEQKDQRLLEDIRVKYQAARELILKLLNESERLGKLCGGHILKGLNEVLDAIFQAGSTPPTIEEYSRLVDKIIKTKRVTFDYDILPIKSVYKGNTD